MKYIKIGDVFGIHTKNGNGYFQYIYERKNIGQLIRVLPGLYPEETLNIAEIVKSPELYFVHFPITAAYRRKIIFRVGNFPLPKSLILPIKFRDRFANKDGELLYWDIVDYKTWKRDHTEKLTDDQMNLSSWGIWNDILLIERLEQGWTLDKWV